MGHRGGYDSKRIKHEQVPAAGAPPEPIDPRHFRGFSYFLGEPDAASRSSIGADPAKARSIFQALYNLLPIVPHPPDNTAIPSGYTYLLQLVAHDMVDTTVPFWAAAETGVRSRNMRDAALGLDTLYGGGPTVCPIAFEPDGALPDYSTQLRLGRIGDAAALHLAGGACPFRDLARLKLDPAGPAANFDDASMVYTADVRSDDNTLLSQIVVLFSILHNAIAAKLSALGPQARFAHASSAMLLMYHTVIRQDLLPRLLDNRVLDGLKARSAADPAWLWHGEAVPLEFTHGAFRVGHAMVRPFYQFNTGHRFDLDAVLAGPPGSGPVRKPLPASWIVEWARFFELGGTPNYSRKLGIHANMPLDLDGLFKPITPHASAHMTIRDWLSAASARMWRSDRLVAAVRPHYPDLPFMDASAIGTWLIGLTQSADAMPDAKAIVLENVDLLTADLPLPLYVLLEAQLDPANGGTHMGPLGSIIVGETILRRLATEGEKLGSVIPAAKQALGADWARIESVRSMPELVRLAEDWGNLTDCPQVPFIAA